MSTDTTSTIELSAKDYKGKVDPDWCPGCGDFGVLRSLQAACSGLGILPHEIVTVSGIGCSSNFPGFFTAYGMHTLHGRALAVGAGVKLANHELTVIGKAGANRWRGRRPKVRGVAMNPVDHPLGGGEGRASGGRPPVSPWGKREGKKTRKHKKESSKYIVRGRKRGKATK